MVNKINRKCQGCAKIFERKNLIKITLCNEKIYINPSSKILGRSAYVCADANCIKNLIKKKRLFSALKFKNFEEISSAHSKLLELVSNDDF